MTDIARHHTSQRMSQIVVHGDTIYLSGQVGEGETVAAQTQSCLDKIDTLLAEAGVDKTQILQSTIWLADMADFAEMNGVWDAWVAKGHAPARACGEARLARADLRVEVLVIAARG
ncbi:Enamine deaminase RidA, house cleaning of reactive enamine intermediates, YjgF/YER057c/UK114 family [Jannaschia faecimaris]|uniref:Enamine deaminase RidA, house cleaning of reactive enamine intermediates, YjgF/YER057c/UK114 family n=1 Tax=Jannaschia faecimaris TaxID=1244108 RepID=A0A1H3MCJ9_9RHOB|nr:RidA family protein [Jannaschia faecimaris]SDY74452.1 Enamine deaminase RidA, house cleaning of reactive enamine intermediates, YjgF/YER057c/UK114 family [Jannaschia faecimaris]